MLLGMCMQSGMRTGKLARTQSENTYAVKKCAQPRDARDAYAVAGHAGHEWRPHNGCRATVRKRGSRNPQNCAGVQKRKSPARRVSARAVSGKRPVLTGRGRESEAKTESRSAIEPSGIKRKGPPSVCSGGP